MPEAASTAIATEIATTLFKATAPTGLAWVKNVTYGKRLVIVGHNAVGKSSFATFLRHGILPQDKSLPSTPENLPIARFQLMCPDSARLSFHVKKTFDFAGHAPPKNQVQKCTEYRPHAIILVHDVNTKGSKIWITQFLNQLGHALSLPENAKFRKGLSHLQLVANKIDLLTQRELADQRRSLKAIIEGAPAAIHATFATIPISETVLIASKRGVSSANQAIQTLALRLQ